MNTTHKSIITLIRVLIPIIVIATVVLVSSPFRFRAGWLYLSGHSSIGLFESLEAGPITAAQLLQVAQVHAKTKLIERDPAGLSLWNTQLGRFWMVTDSRDALEWDLAEQTRKIYGKGDRGERAGDIVLDCGANVGLYAKTALASGAKLVVAIEPAPENVECLRRNLAREITERKVVVWPKGVWDKEDTLTLNRDPNNSARDSFLRLEGPSISGIQVPLSTIDKLVADLNLARVDFIKMDIEGSECKAILGAQRTLTQFKPRMALCVYHQPGDRTAVPQEVLRIAPNYRVSLQGFMLKDSIFAEIAHFW